MKKLFATLVAVALVAAACGRSDDNSASGESPTDTSAPSADSASGEFGDLGVVCGPGDASGATDVGVTDDTITVGTIADAGFEGNPGLNQEIFDAAQAFVGWCNDAGGIQGRQIELVEHDAALTDYQPRIIQACESDLALVGSGGILDGTGAQDRVDCGLPEFNAFTAQPAAQDADLLYPVLPNPTDQLNPGPPLSVLSQEFDGSFDAIGLLYDEGIGPELGERITTGVDELGGDVVYNATFATEGEANWAPFVQAMDSAGVELLFWVGDERNNAALLQAMSDLGTRPTAILTSPNLYTDTWVELAGANSENVFTYAQTAMFEEAGDNEAVQQYLDIVEEYVGSNVRRTALAVQAFSAWLLFATAADACGSDLTRECLAEEASGITEWTGGGLQAPANPGENRISVCAAIVSLTPDGFDRFAPESGYDCDPSYTVDVPGQGLGATVGG